MFSKLRLITFDAKDTIISMTKSAGQLYAEVAGIYGVKLHEKNVRQMESSFKTCFDQVNTLYPNYGNNSNGNPPTVSLLKWWCMVMEKVFKAADFDENKLPREVLDQICAHSYKSFASSDCWAVKGNAMKELAKIKSMRPDIKMGVVSNGDQRLEVLLIQLGLRHFFDFVIDSHTYCCEKPSKEIFDIALSKAGISDPSLALHVGDDLVTDYNGAMEAGWHALLLTVEDKVESFKGKVKDDHVITLIEQLIQK